MANNIVIRYVLFIRNNFFQLNIAYIFSPNDSLIFYSISAVLLNGWEDFINISSSTNSE